MPDLLEEASRTAAAAGAERMFLRVGHDDPLIQVARRNGFFPCVPETLYRLTSVARPSDAVRVEALSDGIREKASGDDYQLFRLYNAATPHEVRALAGMTFDQWTASRERLGGRCREWVLDRDGAIRGWVRAGRRAGSGYLETLIHPDHETGVGHLVDQGLKSLRGSRAAYCLAAQHQMIVGRVLDHRGFRPVAEFLTLVKSMSVVAKEEARARATIASTWRR